MEQPNLSEGGKIAMMDRELKMDCIKLAVQCQAISPLDYAKEIYEWVKEESVKAQSDGEKWNIKTDEVKYSYDLTGCSGSDKTVVADI